MRVRDNDCNRARAYIWRAIFLFVLIELFVGFLFVTRACAEPLDLSHVVLIGGQALDAGVTLNRLQPGACREGNSLIYGSYPSPARVIVTKAVAVSAVLFIAHRLSPSHPTAAKVVRYIGGTLGATAGVMNLSRCQ